MIELLFMLGSIQFYTQSMWFKKLGMTKILFNT